MDHRLRNEGCGAAPRGIDRRGAAVRLPGAVMGQRTGSSPQTAEEPAGERTKQRKGAEHGSHITS